MDVKIYVDTDADIRSSAALSATSPSGVGPSSRSSAVYGHGAADAPEFVEPSKRYADIIIPKGVQRSRH